MCMQSVFILVVVINVVCFALLVLRYVELCCGSCLNVVGENNAQAAEPEAAIELKWFSLRGAVKIDFRKNLGIWPN